MPRPRRDRRAAKLHLDVDEAKALQALVQTADWGRIDDAAMVLASAAVAKLTEAIRERDAEKEV
jgi:hypothetical protein